jgi:hypothetical protein
MTALQMLYEFEIGYELANLSSRNYNQKEVSTMLTQAQNQLVLEVLDSDYSEMKDLLISKLKGNSGGTLTTAPNIPNSYLSGAITGILKVLHERVDIELFSTNPYYSINTTHIIRDVPVITITEDYYNANINNPDKKPYEKLVWRLQSASRNILIGSETYKIINYETIFIRNPLPIIIQWSDYTITDGTIDTMSWVDWKTVSLNCELEEIFHRKIVDRAIVIALEASGNQRLQTKVSIT